MLELARESRRLTQAQLAEAAGLAQGTVSKLEGGLLEPQGDTLTAIAEVLRYPEEFFTRQTEPPARLLPREMATLPARDRRAVVASMKIRCLELSELLRSVEIPDVKVPRLCLHRDVGSPSDAATRIRELWRIPAGPINNLTTLLEDHGIVVIAEDFGVSGMYGLSQSSSNSPDLPPLIVINSSSPGDRIRFTMAHELGHHVLHHHEHATVASEDCEEEANEFSSAFLMPERDIAGQFHSRITLEELASLKQHWKVSMQALLVRGQSLGRIPHAHATRLWKRISMLGYRRNEPVEVAYDQPTLLGDIIEEYRTGLEYSNDELSALIKLHPDEFGERYLGIKKGLRLLRDWKPPGG
ncbi:MAG: ImmA/IrrE family metallo-endopeptidase [Myxococcales bacterium]|nr:ImmA/IrrE family metallo-endopeptidase [Myxococcales bacterium]